MVFRKPWTLLLAVIIGLVFTAPGARGFGQNKVQYKDLKWSVIETEHFEVYFYEGEREAAMDAARMAERAYTRLSTILRHEIEEKVPLILYASQSDFQASNIFPDLISEGTGGLTEFVKRRVQRLVSDSEQPLRAVVLDASGVNDIDTSAVEAITELLEELDEQGIAVHVANAKGPVRDVLMRAGTYQQLGDRIHDHVDDAVRALTPADRPSSRSVGRE